MVTALALCFGIANAHAQSKPRPTLDGSWAQLIVTTSVAKLPVIGKTENTSYYFARVDVSQRGGTLTLKSEPCMVRMEGSVKRVKTIIPGAMVRVMGPAQRTGSVDTAGQVKVLRAVDVLGARLDDPWREALPTDADDPRVIDEDGDGEPGVTVKIVGPIDGEIYLVQRAWNALDGEVSEGGDEIRGSVSWKTSQEVVGASSMFLAANPEARPHPDARRSWFAMKRIDPSATCGWIRKHHNQLFEL